MKPTTRFATLAAAAAVAALAPSAARAQAHTHGHGQHQAQAAQQVAACPALTVHMALEHRAQLGLSDAQAARLDSLQTALYRMHESHRGQMHASGGSGGHGAHHGSAGGDAARAHGQMHETMSTIDERAKSVFTPEQRARFQALHAEHSRHHGTTAEACHAFMEGHGKQGGEHGSGHHGQHHGTGRSN